MKTKFLLTLLSVGGLLVSASSAFAYSPSPDRAEIANLSQKISELVELDGDAQSLVEMAIDRALLAQAGNSTRSAQPIVNGKVINPNPGPIINGKVINPNSGPIINGVVVPTMHPRGRFHRQPNTDRPVLINGVMPAPNSPQDGPLINGTILNPNAR
jgi:hypothetical protein